jgi:hypothetical protein
MEKAGIWFVLDKVIITKCGRISEHGSAIVKK